MARVQIEDSLSKEIQKKFKGESHKIVKLLQSLEENPLKGKFLCQVAGVDVKELKYKSFRFYFIVEGNLLRFFDKKVLSELLIRFVRMSNKKEQQKTINEIRELLLKMDVEGF